MESDREETGLALRRKTLDSWTDPTPLTLDTLRAELGEPSRAAAKWCEWSGGTKYPDVVKWLGDDVILVAAAKVHTLGQLRRLLSVIRETETRSGDADAQ